MNRHLRQAIEAIDARAHGNSWRYFDESERCWYLIGDYELEMFGIHMDRQAEIRDEYECFERWLEKNEHAVTKMGANS